MLREVERSWWLAEHLFRIAGHDARPILQLSCSSVRSLPIFSISPQTRGSTSAPTPREEPMTESRLVQCPACGATNRVPMDEMKSGRQPVCGRCKTALAVNATGPVPVTDATFAAQVERSTLPVLVDAWAPWCGPYRMIAPVVDQLAAETGRPRAGREARRSAWTCGASRCCSCSRAAARSTASWASDPRPRSPAACSKLSPRRLVRLRRARAAATRRRTHHRDGRRRCRTSACR